MSVSYSLLERNGDVVHSFIVRVTYNDENNDPGVAYYGPFLTREEAASFETHWVEDSQEVEDIETLYLNTVVKIVDE